MLPVQVGARAECDEAGGTRGTNRKNNYFCLSRATPSRINWYKEEPELLQLGLVGVGTGVRHAENSSARVRQVWPKLILEWFSPEGFSSCRDGEMTAEGKSRPSVSNSSLVAHSLFQSRSSKGKSMGHKCENLNGQTANCNVT